ncbi:MULTISPECIES: hypothetical protein [unclassified Halorubrum]|uniref:hypothetical protein n=1 Tax=unclassified Halorubrum TaxID=2642239 RepID=UPI000B9817DE|nr:MULTISPECIES: hypothetical protein [unclassified Halorubrum]OYR43561.1 hypothetical protein DJ75_11720 [Halorubrum sp. Eb13]OYR48357.1 hypothetical protein DJ74_10720 [Halorubrum sp. Ea8]
MAFAALGDLLLPVGARFDASDDEPPIDDSRDFGSETDASDRTGTGDREVGAVGNGAIAVDRTEAVRR